MIFLIKTPLICNMYYTNSSFQHANRKLQSSLRKISTNLTDFQFRFDWRWLLYVCVCVCRIYIYIYILFFTMTIEIFIFLPCPEPSFFHTVRCKINSVIRGTFSKPTNTEKTLTLAARYK